MNKKKPSLLRSLGIGFAVLLALFAYAYGFQVTKVDLAETKSERRQVQLTRILRALAHPELFYYETDDFTVSLPVMMPCPEEGFEAPPPEDKNAPYIVMTPACADPRATVTVEGFNFEPFATGPLNFMPADSDVSLQLDTIETDGDGHFEAEVRLSNRPNDKVQALQATTRRKVGAPKLTQTAYDTWDKIIETVFLALLATTFGTLLAIPLSFVAARNLMKDVKSSLIAMSLAIILIPFGLYIGNKVASLSATISAWLAQNTLLAILGLIIAGVILWMAIRWEFSRTEQLSASLRDRSLRAAAMLALAFVTTIGLYLLSFLAMAGGDFAAEHLGSLGFLGRFVRDLGDILGMAVSLMAALTGAGAMSGFAGRLALKLNEGSDKVVHFVQIVLTMLAGALLFLLVAMMLNWLYEYNNYLGFYAWAAGIGGLLGLILGFLSKPRQTMPTGLTIYFVIRTIFNAIRSIEPLVWAIVFVVWVGIGPFAGSMALALHTIAALGKLYSEQVENIMEGPLEAIQATGANRLQTIIYAVIPQIVPPYVSFTMYRWDINVRMSTIIGFAGGGGIGFLLLQNINLLNYRAASAQMLAIAIVVAAMDYISSAIREHYV